MESSLPPNIAIAQMIFGYVTTEAIFIKSDLKLTRFIPVTPAICIVKGEMN
ncbi:hypothetical protein QSE00_07495 [Arenibacter sp. M-2]|uniref:hypothetical protein n=1 Tax=unclassified Arenibacter TaxID=2615047 RepID=UPI000D835426|nr:MULTISPECIES: hypothetical protein [unclassified Arenibacter]MDL5511648.1 hypothetical protein [Arenibacter sp. M-2]PXX24582.1 hypothetical protein C7972_11559 [Arenibacter sp. ARW7G5Y1]